MLPNCRLITTGSLSILLCALISSPAQAQLSYGGAPPSFTVQVGGDAPTEVMPVVNEAVLLMQDARRPKNQPFRFGKSIAVDLALENSGVWDELPNGARLWRLRIESVGARSINLTFGRYYLPDGAELYVYNDDRTMVLGSYNALNNAENRQFATEAVFSDAITLEYMEPAWVDFHGEIQVNEVVHAYREITVYLLKSSSSFGASGSCEVDVACPAGSGWEDQINAVARILTGPYLCTGSLLNNTANDGTQYFITASHCGTLNTAVFYFNYEMSGCGTGTAPLTSTVQGSTQMAVDTKIDYRLVKITPTIPASYNPYFAGWDRSDSTPASTTCIHHPAGDPKKISFDYNSPSKIGNDWEIYKWDVGATESGSSGSPLYDSSGRFIGQLWGGQASCTYPYYDYFGRLAKSWANVKSFLDPINSGVTSINGYDPNGCPTPTSYGTGEFGSTGRLATMGWTGTPSVGSYFSVDVSGVRPNAFGVLLRGMSQVYQAYSWGYVLVGSPGYYRTYVTTMVSGTCQTIVPVLPAMVGTTVNYQYLVRDRGYGGGVQSSNGLAVTFCP